MKKAYLYNNYVVIEDGINVYLFNIYNSFTVVNSNDYTVQSSVGNRAVILIADASNWYDETGTIPFNAASLLLFLETYTGQFQKAENGIPEGGTTGQILAKIDGTDYNAEWIDNFANWTSQLKHEVKAGVPLIKGQAVYVSSADGTNMIVSKASNASEMTSSKTIGLIAQSLSTNGKGFVITEGLLAGLNTSTAIAGDPVWLGTDGNLIFGYLNKPHAPQHLVFIGIVTRSNNNNGEIFVKVQNGFELEELHNVAITSPANKNTILFNSTTSLWENRLIAIDDVSNLQSSLDAKENTSNKGIANGYASLGGDGKVPSTQLPSYVDDVIEVANYAALPSVGETGVIYITLDNNNVYRWSGSTYVQISQPNAIWGSITGTLSNQTDLQSALNAKQDLATAINTSNIGLQSVAYAINAGNADTLDGYHASAFQMALTNPVTGTGTLNYVAKFGSSSTIENSQIYDNGFQVGIGTTLPNAKLGVAGTIKNEQYHYITNTYDGRGIYADDGGGSTIFSLTRQPSNEVRLQGYSSLTFFTDGSTGSEKMRITYDGKIGMGVSNPASKLHLSGATTLLTITDTTYNRTSQIGYLDQANLYFANDSNSNTYIGRYNNVFLAYGGGNVGIGTETPFRKLDVNGALRLQTGTIDFGNSVNNQIWVASDNINFKTNGSEKAIITSAGNFGIGTSNPLAKLDVLNKILIGEDAFYSNYYTIGWGGLTNGYNRIFSQSLGGSGDGLYIASATGRSIYFRPNGDTIDKMVIAASGNVGIGTTSFIYPASGRQILAINGSVSSLLEFQFSNSIGGYIYVSSTLYEQSSAYAPQTFLTSNSERMRITAGGNIGIGTSNPLEKLHVGGNILLPVSNSLYLVPSSTNYGIGTPNSDGVQIFTGVGDHIRFGHMSSGASFTERMRVASSGNVGVGTTNPIWKFVVSNGGAAGLEIDPDNGSAGYVGVYSYNRASGSYFPLMLQAANYYFTIGSVGIGTSSIHSSAILDLTSTTKGFLPPRMSDAEMNAISSPATGLMVWNNDIGSLFVFDGGSWRKIAYV